MFGKHVLSAISYSRGKLCMLSPPHCSVPAAPRGTPRLAAQDLTAQFWQIEKKSTF